MKIKLVEESNKFCNYQRKMSSTTRTEILSEMIQIYEGYKTDAKKRGEYDMSEWYEKTLVDFRNQLKVTK